MCLCCVCRCFVSEAKRSEMHRFRSSYDPRAVVCLATSLSIIYVARTHTTRRECGEGRGGGGGGEEEKTYLESNASRAREQSESSVTCEEEEKERERARARGTGMRSTRRATLGKDQRMCGATRRGHSSGASAGSITAATEEDHL